MTQYDPALLQALKWRCIGPPRGGRVVAVAGHPTEPATFYFGACAGRVWKTNDAGTYWENISDDFSNTKVIGPILGGALIHWLDYAWTFRLLGLLLVFGAMLVWGWSQFSGKSRRERIGASI